MIGVATMGAAVMNGAKMEAAGVAASNFQTNQSIANLGAKTAINASTQAATTAADAASKIQDVTQALR